MAKETITTPTDRLEAALRNLVKSLIKKSGKNRAIIARRMTAIIEARTAKPGRPISKRMIDDWVSPKMRARFPAALIEAFCEAVDDDTLQRHVIGARLRDLLAIGESVIEAAGSLKRAHEAVARIVEQGRHKAE